MEARRRGFNAAWPVFIPFLGAYVAIRDARMNPWQSFWISFAGPALGRRRRRGASGSVGEQQGSRLLQALGYAGFLLNLINMLPIGFLDGGSIWRSIKTMRVGGTPGKAKLATVAFYVGARRAAPASGWSPPTSRSTGSDAVTGASSSTSTATSRRTSR